MLLRYRSFCHGVLAIVPLEDLADAKPRVLRLLQDPQIPLDMEPKLIIAGLDDAVADHAEALLARLGDSPQSAYIERDARRALIRLEKERFDYLMTQLQNSIATAGAEDDAEALTDLRFQFSALYERHRQSHPPRSPYFRDSRDGDLPLRRLRPIGWAGRLRPR